MQKLILDLNTLEAQSYNQESKLNNLFLELDEIQKIKQDILHQQMPKENLFIRIRPELFVFVLVFLDLKTCLRFRLVSSRSNTCVVKSLNRKIKQLHDQQGNLENELNEILKNLSQDVINQDLLATQQNAHNGLTQLNKGGIDEIRMYQRPPQVVLKLISLVCILLDSNIKQNQEDWADCQKILKDSKILLNKLLHLEIENISDSQLKLLQPIHNIYPQQVQNISSSCYGLFLFIQSIVVIRESKYYSCISIYQLYSIKNQKINLEKQMKSNANLIEKLFQISK